MVSECVCSCIKCSLLSCKGAFDLFSYIRACFGCPTSGIVPFLQVSEVLRHAAMHQQRQKRRLHANFKKKLALQVFSWGAKWINHSTFCQTLRIYKTDWTSFRVFRESSTVKSVLCRRMQFADLTMSSSGYFSSNLKHFLPQPQRTLYETNSCGKHSERNMWSFANKLFLQFAEFCREARSSE